MQQTDSGPPLDVTLDRKDFVSGQEVRWCPGCGDYSILYQCQKVLPKLGIPREKFVFVSGIGCSSRFPYYMNTYGFHSIHGRAPTVATGLKLANPDLSVWVMTGDGDGLSIGGNHLLHAMRRNIDINIVLFNNRIYGLTKGQYSPTSVLQQKTKTSPMGTVEQPINPLCIAIASEATFVARSVDADTEHLGYVLERAARHKGVSFVEVYQNCLVFNDGAFKDFTAKAVRADNVLYLEHGKPMVFGKDRDKGIVSTGAVPRVATIGDDGVTEEDVWVHDERAPSAALAYMLTQMHFPVFPVRVGVFRAVEKPTYEEQVHAQIAEAHESSGEGTIEDLLQGSSTWDVA